MAKKAKKKTVKKKAVKKPRVKKILPPPRGEGIKPHLTYDEIEWIKALLAVTPSKQRVADETKRSWATIDKISKLKEEEIEIYRAIKRKGFIKKAWEKIDMLMDKITDGKCAFATVNQITTAMGTVYDKAALASGDVTDRSEVEIKMTIRDLLTKCRQTQQKTSKK